MKRRHFGILPSKAIGTPAGRGLRLLACVLLTVTCSPLGPDLGEASASGRIAFIGGGENRNFQPFVGSAAGGRPVQLVTDRADYTGLSWSPDGRNIAFASSRAGNAIYVIYVMDIAGSDVRRVYGAEQSVFAPAWSPDGSQIAFQKQGTIQTGWDLYIINVDGTGLKVLTETNADEEMPAWSPDGKRIAYQAGRGSRNIYIIDVDGSNREKITNGLNTVLGAPAWSPDGGTLAVHSTIHRGDQPRSAWGQFEIYTVNLEDGQLTRLTFLADETRAVRMPSWSPDGTRIAFESQLADDIQFAFQYRIMVMNRDGSGLREIDFGRGARFPRWAPN